MKQSLFLIIAVVVFSFCSCVKKENQISGLKMLAGGKTFAVPTGTAADQFVLKKFPDAHIIYFNSSLDCALAVKGGKADAACYDKPILKNIAAKNEGLTVLTELLADDKYGFAVQIDKNKLKLSIDSVLSVIKEDGTYDDMMKRWFPEKGKPAPMPDLKLNGNKGVLRFGTAAVTEPMSFHDSNHKIAGFDIEFAERIAMALGKKLDLVDMDFGAMVPALISGKVDMIGAGLSITEERSKKVLFSESYYPNGIAALVKSYPESSKAKAGAKLRSGNDISNKRIGVMLGTVHDAYARKNYPNSEILEYHTVPDMITALNSGKVDAAFIGNITLKEIMKKNRRIGILESNIYSNPLGIGFRKENPELREQFNTFLKEIKSNGTYDDMIDRWMKKDNYKMPEIPTPGKNGTLTVGIVSSIGFPQSGIDDGKNAGFDIELTKRFAAYSGKDYVPVDLVFSTILASLKTSKIDMSACSMMITEERQKQIDFSDPYYSISACIIAMKNNMEIDQSVKLAKTDDISDKRVGVFTGTVHDQLVSRKYPKAVISRYESSTDMVAALSGDKIDVALLDNTTARLIIKRNPDLGLLSDDLLSMPLGVGFNKNNPSLRNEFNNFLKEIKKDGSYERMYKRWCIDDAEEAVMPEYKTVPKGKKLIIGTNINDLPYVSIINGSFAGFDIEMIETFASRYNYNAEFVSMQFSSLITALASGKVDMISDGIAITEERAKQINFADSYADFKTAVIASRKNLSPINQNETEASDKSIAKAVTESFYNNIITEKRYLLIIDGLRLTILISIFAAFFGTIVGGLICFMRMSGQKFLSSIARIYITLLRGTPVLVLLMIIYYVVFGSVNVNPAFVAVFAFGLNFGAYVSEMFRTSIESIDRGQKEAGIAGGFTKIQTFIHIIMPQAVRQALPVYKGEFISLVKMTSIVGYIAVQDLTKASDIIRSRTFDAFFPLIMAAVLYLLIAWLLTWALDLVEISVDPKKRRLTNLRETSK